MNDYAALHATSLLLVGKSLKIGECGIDLTFATPEATHADSLSTSSISSVASRKKSFDFTRNEIQTASNDTGIEIIMQQSNKPQQDVLLLPVDDASAGPDESRWRSHGKARRRKLLEEDQRNGGRDFSMTFDCSVQRYFSVAHWALEQFHQLYQNSSSSSTDNEKELEELYLMGHRIVSFLTECLPQHPGLGRAPLVRHRSKQELNLLEKCLEDVALRIDEQVCNHFGDDGDLFLDSMLIGEMDKDEYEEDGTSSSSSSPDAAKQPDSDAVFDFEANWVDFSEAAFGVDNTKNSKFVSFAKDLERKSAESPTAETIGTTGTTGTGSLGPTDNSYANCDSSRNSEGNEEIRRSSAESIDENDTDDDYEDEDDDYVDDDDDVVEYNYDDENDRVIRDDDNDHFEVDEFSEEEEDDDDDDDDDYTYDNYTYDDYTYDEEDDFDLHSRSGTMFKGVRLDFLRTIACQPVLYETDSEAADSWANTVDESTTTASRSRPCLPSSSGVTPTCDPARLAFRDLMNKLPHESILQRNNESKQLMNGGPLYLSPVPSPLMQSPSTSPTLMGVLGERDSVKTSNVGYTNFDDLLDHEIKDYLDSSQVDEDPRKFVETFHEKLNVQSNGNDSSTISRPQRRDSRSAASSYVSSSSSSSSSSTVQSSSSSSSLKSLINRTGSQTSAFSSFSRSKQQQQPTQKQQQQPIQKQQPKSNSVFEVEDWISFDNSSGNSYFADSSF
mmetsp:Transcript_2009/g.4449  ORF Transcript_2009/g.4449 Transcript_2009/m.4449 type:complete len:728 (+) Transcript_2009:237-2420(+)|eukprot:CAMPEP_0172412098 /NCGR_PEP_ID=MMETSP1061-20121228/77730_1 /TAXON_ID=37318 /ORGANISM="Pseudo-nitzschia pungens, Strain cf. pungens" /LENGTH=727 /DNA_ID=CAMNT_0013148321 /DNA_START=191 /DNA_END=2374 /DNA_ORIENTATION=-